MTTVADSTTGSPEMSLTGLRRMDPLGDGEGEDPTLLEGIMYPGKHDVMLGRGGESTYHCGNIAFRQLVEDHKTKYYTCPRAHKSRVVAEVVQKWRRMDPPGRFLTRMTPIAGAKSAWHDVGDGRALKKASHSLRDAVRCFSVEKKQRAQQTTKTELDLAASTPTDNMNSNTRKRVRSLDPAVFSTTSGVPSSLLAQQWELVAVHKPKDVVVPTLGMVRPAKKQRTVSDEGRQEPDDDDRRDGTIPVAPFFASPPRHRLVVTPRIASPCGSADWFAAGTEDLPVQASSALPIAEVLVQEVVVSDSSYDHNSGRDSASHSSGDDDDSLGWFADVEQDIPSFTPLLDAYLSLQRPVAIASHVNVSSGRE